MYVDDILEFNNKPIHDASASVIFKEPCSLYSCGNKMAENPATMPAAIVAMIGAVLAKI